MTESVSISGSSVVKPSPYFWLRLRRARESLVKKFDPKLKPERLIQRSREIGSLQHIEKSDHPTLKFFVFLFPPWNEPENQNRSKRLNPFSKNRGKHVAIYWSARCDHLLP